MLFRSETSLPLTAPIVVSNNGHGTPTSTVNAQARWESFANLGQRRNNGERFMGDELTQMYAYLETLVDRYADPTLWTERHEDEVAIRSALTLLRFLVGQIGQTVHEPLVEDKTGGES